MCADPEFGSRWLLYVGAAGCRSSCSGSQSFGKAVAGVVLPVFMALVQVSRKLATCRLHIAIVQHDEHVCCEFLCDTFLT